MWLTDQWLTDQWLTEQWTLARRWQLSTWRLRVLFPRCIRRAASGQSGWRPALRPRSVHCVSGFVVLSFVVPRLGASPRVTVSPTTAAPTVRSTAVGVMASGDGSGSRCERVTPSTILTGSMPESEIFSALVGRPASRQSCWCAYLMTRRARAVLTVMSSEVPLMGAVSSIGIHPLPPKRYSPP